MEGFEVPPSWQDALTSVLATAKTRQLHDFLIADEVAGKNIFPPRTLCFRALEMTPLPTVKVVILGQDPYFRPGQAHGLSFSVPIGVPIPRSLANVQKELQSDLAIPRASHGNLQAWAERGVLLLNNLLTVEEGSANSHKKRGWEEITDAIVAAVVAKAEACVFLLWGNDAQEKARRVPGLSVSQHLILTTRHPSGRSASKGFFGCKHFSKANAFLEANGRGAIDWRV